MTGIGDLRGIVSENLTTGIAVAISIPKNIIRDLQTAPTKEYYDAYHAINAQLDKIVESGAEFLRKNGFHAYANTTQAERRKTTQESGYDSRFLFFVAHHEKYGVK